MKKIATFLFGAALALQAAAVPAHPAPGVVTQPDGTTLSIRLCGDEFYHFNTTLDGYTVVKNTAGAWVYAVANDNKLTASTIVAHDASARTAMEQAFVATHTKRLTDRVAVEQSKQVRAVAQAPARMKLFDYSKFRGLIVLVQPSDTKFAHATDDETRQYYDTMVNTHDFTGFDNTSLGRFTGSVRDYYYDNSNGIFDPQFDIVGPVTVSYKATEINNKSRQAFINALGQVKNQVDFSKYDGDNNGYVDMVFFIVAGNGSNVSGNPSGLLWPHKSTGLNPYLKYNGVAFDVYACSTELTGAVGSNTIDGIGTICHEFTHVLGLPDLYDADYETNGQSHHPGEWDIMAGGSYHNYSRTPAGYGIWERYALGFANPPVISETGTYSLEALGNSNTGFIVKSPLPKEFFMIENRQSTKWDSCLPGHGMIVVRVDSASTAVWTGNSVNNNANRNYYELVRAATTDDTDYNGPCDSYPGATGTSRLGAGTVVPWQTWNKTSMPLSLNRISEDKNGVISFELIDEDDINMMVEGFENMAVSTTGKATKAQGEFTQWDFTNCDVMAPEATARVGAHSVGMYAPSLIRMCSDVEKRCYAFSANVYNPNASEAKFKLSYSIDGGNSWKEINNSIRTVPANSRGAVYWAMDFNEPVRFRMNMTSGTKTKTSRCYIDEVTIYHDGDFSPIYVTGDVDGNGMVDVDDVNAVVNIILGLNSAADFKGVADVNDSGIVDVDDVNALINIILGIG